MEDDMDINCGVILEGTPLPVVGRQIFEEVLAVASGKRSKSELSGVGEEEFPPWIIGPAMRARASNDSGLLKRGAAAAGGIRELHEIQLHLRMFGRAHPIR